MESAHKVEDTMNDSQRFALNNTGGLGSNRCSCRLAQDCFLGLGRWVRRHTRWRRSSPCRWEAVAHCEATVFQHEFMRKSKRRGGGGGTAMNRAEPQVTQLCG